MTDDSLRQALRTGQLAGLPPFRFGPFVADPSRGTLTSPDGEQHLTPKVMMVLVCLAGEQGATLTRETLLDRVWGDLNVTESVLSRAISLLRKALNDHPGQPLYVETIPKIGYRFIPEIQSVEVDEKTTLKAPLDLEELKPSMPEHPRLPEPQSTVLEGPKVRKPRLGMPAWVSAGFAAGAALFFALSPFSATDPKPTDSLPLLRLEEADPGFFSEPLQVLPFTSWSGIELDPSFSPDGSKIAFSWSSKGDHQFDLFVQPTNSEEAVRITSDPGLERSPTWSPDGLKIAYIRARYDSENYLNTQDIYVASTTGSERQRINHEPLNVRPGMSWSPDGRFIAVADEVDRKDLFKICLIDVNTRQKSVITHPPGNILGDWYPRFSPDGTHIAFLRSSWVTTMNICLVRLSDGMVTQLTQEQSNIQGLAWRDQNQLLFSADRNGVKGLWSLDIRNPEKEPAWVSGADFDAIGNLCVSSDGSKFAFERWQRNTDVVSFSPSHDSEIPRVVVSSSRVEYSPAYNEKNGRLAYVSNRDGKYQVWSCSLNGQDNRKHTAFEGSFIGPPAWHPDGRYIAFHVNEGSGNGKIYVLDLESGRAEPVTGDHFQNRFPTWSQDGSSLYFSSDRSGSPQIWCMPFEKGQAACDRIYPITKNGGLVACEGPNGYLYYQKGSGENTELWRAPAPKGPSSDQVLFEEELVYRSKHRVMMWFQWAVHAEGIYFTEWDPSGFTDLYNLNPDSGKARRVGTLTQLNFHTFKSLQAANNEDRVFYIQTNQVNADLVLVRGSKS